MYRKRAKSERLFAHLLFFIFKLSLGYGLDFKFGLGLGLGLEPGLGFGLGLRLGFGIGYSSDFLIFI